MSGIIKIEELEKINITKPELDFFLPESDYRNQIISWSIEIAEKITGYFFTKKRILCSHFRPKNKIISEKSVDGFTEFIVEPSFSNLLILFIAQDLFWHKKVEKNKVTEYINMFFGVDWQ